MRGAVTRATHVVALSAVILMGGCDLEEVTIVEPESVLVVEAFLLLGDLETIGRVFLYSSLGAGPNDDLPVAEIVLSSESGGIFEFTEAHALVCLSLAPEVEAYGRCYVGQEAGAPLFRPGDRVTLEVRTELGSGAPRIVDHPRGLSRSTATLHRSGVGFQRTRPSSCPGPARRGRWATWARPGCAAYRRLLAERGLVVTDDPLILRGLSVSADDTSIRFPSDFGIFERLALDADLARALQVGMPPGHVGRRGRERSRSQPRQLAAPRRFQPVGPNPRAEPVRGRDRGVRHGDGTSRSDRRRSPLTLLP